MTGSRRALTGVDGDTEAIIAELEALVAALKAGESHLQEVEHVDRMAVEATSTETVEVTYTLSDEFRGIDPVQYELPEPRGDAE